MKITKHDKKLIIWAVVLTFILDILIWEGLKKIINLGKM